MTCYGGYCCWWKKKPHPPHPPIHPPDPSVLSTHPPVETPEEPSASTSTPVEVLKSFNEVDIDKADDFINAIKEQLEGATAHKNTQDTPSTSSPNTDKLSNWPSFIQSGATFLKFASDHTEKNQTKGDFSHPGEATKIAGDMLQFIGQLHWAVAGLSIVGYLVSKCQMVSENRTGYVDLLKSMLKLTSHIKRLNNLSLENENEEVLKNAFQYIVQVSIFCASKLDSRFFFSFLKTSINSETLSGIRSQIDMIYQDMQVISGIETLVQQREMSAQQPIVLPLSQLLYPKNAVGIEEQSEAVNTLLNMKKDEDCPSIAVVIWGFGGIGKTTLAQAVVSTVDLKNYNYARIELDEVSEKNNWKAMQEQILKDAFPSFNGGREVKLRDDGDGRDKLTEAFESESTKPVFLFIDNALHARDLDRILPEDLRGLPQRSRILITTRILSVTDMLKESGLQRQDYQVKTLSDNHAAEILCNDPAIRDGLRDDIDKMINLCNGIPLVLKIVGAHLRKQKYNVDNCTQIVEALQSGGHIKENDLRNRLFDFWYKKLEESTQEAFLDVCCFFDKGFPRRIAEYIVGSEEVAFLQEAAFITTVIGQPLCFPREKYEKEEVLSVHDIIRSIGRSMSKSSRIMDLKSWSEAEKDEGKLKGIKGVWLEYEDCMLEERHLNAMKSTLRILALRRSSINVSATDGVRFPELRCLIKGYMTWESINGDISWVNVEALDKLCVFECEKLSTTQRGPLKLPESLRYITVRKQPAVTRDFVPNSSLEELNISFSRLSKSVNKEIDNSENAFYSRLHGLNKLKTMRTKGCDSLRELPQEVCGLPQLSKLVIGSCSKMERLPQLFGQLKTQHIWNCQTAQV